MHTAHSFFVRTAIALTTAGAALGGSLAPPPGAIAPTMKDLNAVEPRVLLRDVAGNAECVHRITAPGQYVATADIIVPAGKHGVLIELAPGAEGVVSIDLNGFSIVGQPGSIDGIRKAGAIVAADFHYKEGRIVGMGGDGVHVEGAEKLTISSLDIDHCGGDGVDAASVKFVEYRPAQAQTKSTPRHRVTQCGGHGVIVTGCDDLSIHGLSIADCGGSGISLTDCTDMSLSQASIVRVNGALVVTGGARFISSDVSIAEYMGDGASFSSVGKPKFGGWNVKSNVRVAARGGGVPPTGGRALAFDTCQSVQVNDCDIDDCGGHGVELIDCAEVSIAHSRVSRADGSGLREGGRTVGAGVVVEILDFAVHGCGGDGVSISEVIDVRCRDVRVSMCGGDGIEVDGDVLELDDCTTHDNTGHGLHAKNIRKNITVNLFKSNKNQGHGAKILGGRTTQVTRSNISNNRGAGIEAEILGGSLTLEDVDASDNDQGGCFAPLLPALGQVKEKARQTRCRFNNNGHGTPAAFPGLHIMGASSLILREVECSGNAGSGLVVADLDRDGRLDMVTCSDNGEWGVRCMTTTGVPTGRMKVHAVHCGGNAYDGMLLEGTAGGEVADSTFSGNGSLGLRILSFSHLVHRNTFLQNGGGALFALLPGNTVAPIVDEGTLPGNCNPSANHLR